MTSADVKLSNKVTMKKFTLFILSLFASTFVFAETPSNMQLKFTGEKVKAEQSWGIEYDATYSGLIESDSIEKKFSDMIPYMELGSKTVTHVSLVDMGNANGVAKIIKVEVTKTDGSTEELSIPDPSWGYTKE